MTRYNARSLAARLVPLHAERDSREARGVPVPTWLTAAITTLEGQLVNEYNREEADNRDELDNAPPRTSGIGWLWPIAAGLVCLAVAAWWGALS